LKELLVAQSDVNWHYFFDLLFTKYSTPLVNSRIHTSLDTSGSLSNTYKSSNVPKVFNIGQVNSDVVSLDCTDAKKLNSDTKNTEGLYSASQCPWNGNLKLVHIACHIKLPHDVTCSDKYILNSNCKNMSEQPLTKKGNKKRAIVLTGEDEIDSKARKIDLF